MTYAQHRTLYDADSHIMELPNFLSDHVDPGMRERLPAIDFGANSNLQRNLKTFVDQGCAHTDDDIAKMLAMGDEVLRGPKGYDATGAFNGSERSKVLDLLGFKKQLVFASVSEALVFSQKLDMDVRYAAARAHNRAMKDFCTADARLMGVAAVSLDDPDLALAELNTLLQEGAGAVWVPHRHCGGRSPGHTAFDPFWARLQEAGIPFVVHIGGDGLQVDKAWMNNGRPLPKDWLGGGENVRGKDMTSVHHMAERFLSMMVLDGVFERFPRLKGASVELGAGWVPAMLDRLDWVVDIWSKSDEELRKLTRKPSQQFTEQFAFTPYVYEDIGRIISQSNADLYLFSSDYPHPEGGRNPIGRFETSLEGLDASAQSRFYAENFQRVFSV
ncbi:MAG: amidohydrolase family protein [Proteobacteria bacterium]|nr:amidohydrolase family protein [Pseudomonadota bacterium]